MTKYFTDTYSGREIMENSVGYITVHSNSPDREFGTKSNPIIQILCNPVDYPFGLVWGLIGCVSSCVPYDLNYSVGLAFKEGDKTRPLLIVVFGQSLLNLTESDFETRNFPREHEGISVEYKFPEREKRPHLVFRR